VGIKGGVLITREIMHTRRLLSPTGLLGVLWGIPNGKVMGGTQES